jgi:hypothetical protein
MARQITDDRQPRMRRQARIVRHNRKPSGAPVTVSHITPWVSPAHRRTFDTHTTDPDGRTGQKASQCVAF